MLHFEGVEAAFYVWVNGELVGYSEDSFTAAEFNITPYIKKGENIVAVEVYRWADSSWLEDQDFAVEWDFSRCFPLSDTKTTCEGLHGSDSFR